MQSLHPLFHTPHSIVVQLSWGSLGRVTGTLVTLFMAAITANLFGILKQSFTLLAIPSHVGSYTPHFSCGQGKGLSGVAWVAVRMFVGFRSGRS